MLKYNIGVPVQAVFKDRDNPIAKESNLNPLTPRLVLVDSSGMAVMCNGISAPVEQLKCV